MVKKQADLFKWDLPDSQKDLFTTEAPRRNPLRCVFGIIGFCRFQPLAAWRHYEGAAGP